LKRVEAYPLLIASGFLLVGALVMTHHELWRDEVQSWLLARDSSSVTDLLATQRYEGHPALWQLLLYPLTRVFDTPAAMQWLHLLIATTTVYLFMRFAPFSPLQRVLFSFGYFPFYEYSIVSRSYGLSLLLLIVFCCLYPQRDRRIIPIVFTLVLLCHAHALGLIVATVLFAGLWLDRFIPRSVSVAARCSPWSFYAGSALFLIGVIAAVIQIRPPGDSGIAMGWQMAPSYESLRDAGKALVGAYIPVPKLALHYWNHPLGIDGRFFPLNLLCFLAVPAYLLFVFIGLRRNLVAGLVLLGGTFGLLAFFYTKYPGYARHHGFLFACFIVAAWMYRSDDSPESGVVASTVRHPWWRRAFAVSLTLLLGVHAGAAVIASTLEFRYPFSAAGSVADYLRRNGHDESVLVGCEDNAASAILGFSVQKQMYYPQARRWGSFIIWNRARLQEMTDDEMIRDARALPRRTGQHRLLVLNRGLDSVILQKYGISELAVFPGAVVPDENFHLYDSEPTGQPESTGQP